MTEPAFAFGELLKLVVALAVTIGLFYALALFMKRLQVGTGKSGSLITVLAALPLGSKEKIWVVEVGGERLVIGTAPGNVSCLHVLKDAADVDSSFRRIPESGDSTSSFRRMPESSDSTSSFRRMPESSVVERAAETTPGPGLRRGDESLRRGDESLRRVDESLSQRDGSMSIPFADLLAKFRSGPK